MRILAKIDNQLKCIETDNIELLNGKDLLIHTKGMGKDIVVSGLSNPQRKLQELFMYDFGQFVHEDCRYLDYYEDFNVDQYEREISHVSDVDRSDTYDEDYDYDDLEFER